MKIIKTNGEAENDNPFWIKGYKYPSEMKQVGDTLKVFMNGKITYLIIDVVRINQGIITFGVRKKRDKFVVA